MGIIVIRWEWHYAWNTLDTACPVFPATRQTLKPQRYPAAAEGPEAWN